MPCKWCKRVENGYCNHQISIAVLCIVFFFWSRTFGISEKGVILFLPVNIVTCCCFITCNSDCILSRFDSSISCIYIFKYTNWILVTIRLKYVNWLNKHQSLYLVRHLNEAQKGRQIRPATLGLPRCEFWPVTCELPRPKLLIMEWFQIPLKVISDCYIVFLNMRGTVLKPLKG